MDLRHLFEKNRAWAAKIVARDPDFFASLARQQSPDFLWIGCADSRVPANEIVDLPPGELFVHRNVANLVVHSDLNCLSVLQFAVDILKVRHVMVVGHYGCGGIRISMEKRRIGLADNWLRHLADVEDKHLSFLSGQDEIGWQCDRLCELNVLEQVLNVCQTTVVQDAWAREAPLTIHGWVYSVEDGLIRDLGLSVASTAELVPVYAAAQERIYKK
jgi:carbonic anhydrase